MQLACKREPKSTSEVELHHRLGAALDAHNATKLVLERAQLEKATTAQELVEASAKHKAAMLKLSKLVEDFNRTNAATARALNLTAEDLRRMAEAASEAREDREMHRANAKKYQEAFNHERDAKLNFRDELQRHQRLYDAERSAHGKTKHDAKDTKTWLYVVLSGLAATLFTLCLAVACVMRYRRQWLDSLRAAAVGEDNTVYVIGRPAEVDASYRDQVAGAPVKKPTTGKDQMSQQKIP
jgi:hypothetical protein